MNYKLIGIKVGECLKSTTTVDDINRIASAIFDFSLNEYPNSNITSFRSHLIYNWIMTLGHSSNNDEEKKVLLEQFVNELAPPKSPCRDFLKNESFSTSQDFWSLIHDDVRKVSQRKFFDGYYSDAVESAFKEVNSRVKEIVKEKTGQEYDGTDLMNRAFSLGSPIIILDDLSTGSGKDTQKGYLQIFSGSILGIRNPKAHANLTTSRENAIHFIFLASLLMKKIDDSRSFTQNS